MMFKFFQRIIDWFRSGYFLYVARDSGAHHQPTIVFLHGIAATAKTWDLVVENLDSKKYRIVTLDLLGFGQSPKPQRCQYTVDDHMRSVRRTLRSLGVKKVILVGHSMGSIIATRYALKYPKKVRRLFLVSPPLYLKKNETNQSYLVKKETEILIKGFRYILNNKEMSLGASYLVRQILSLQDGAEIMEQNWHSFERSLEKTIIDQNTYHEIKQLKIPTTIIYGSLDGLLVKKVINNLANQNHLNIIEIKNKGHIITKSFAKNIADQLDKTL